MNEGPRFGCEIAFFREKAQSVPVEIPFAFLMPISVSFLSEK
jgi:hypothetical protein